TRRLGSLAAFEPASAISGQEKNKKIFNFLLTKCFSRVILEFRGAWNVCAPPAVKKITIVTESVKKIAPGFGAIVR
ncbi:MAG: hypothetical protein IJI84_06680, partial [Clostridia bacterium]|nr:hypothetical protein [Clostridia bacterium]